MIKTTTQKDLLLYVYNETKLLDSDRIQRAIDGDPLLSNDYQEIVKITETLDVECPAPSEEAIRNILLHAWTNDTKKNSGNFISAVFLFVLSNLFVFFNAP